jgi:ABC-type glycerol-3-phosphate transport system permease component
MTGRPPAALGEAPRAASPRRARRVRRMPNIFGGFGAALWLVFVGFPLYLLVSTSLRNEGSYLTDGPLSLPRHAGLENYRFVLDSDFLHYMANTAIVTVATVAIVEVLTVPAAYAIVRSHSRLVRLGFSSMLAGLAIPAQAVIVPLYLMATRLHLYDTLPAIILPTAAFALPLSIIVLTSTMRDIPGELYEAMGIDGASPARVLRELVLPLSRPGMVTIGIYSALGAWNGFLFPLVLTQSSSSKVLTLGLWDFQTQHGTDVPATTAAVMLSLLPVLVLYLLGRRQLLNGLTAGFGK